MCFLYKTYLIKTGDGTTSFLLSSFKYMFMLCLNSLWGNVTLIQKHRSNLIRQLQAFVNTFSLKYLRRNPPQPHTTAICRGQASPRPGDSASPAGLIRPHLCGVPALVPGLLNSKIIILQPYFCPSLLSIIYVIFSGDVFSERIVILFPLLIPLLFDSNENILNQTCMWRNLERFQVTPNICALYISG